MAEPSMAGDRPDDPLGDEDPGDRAFTEATAAAGAAGSIPPDPQVDEESELEKERLGSDDADTD